MDMYFCLVSAKDAANPVNLGWEYCKKHESEWVQGNPETERYLTIGIVKGIDHVVVNNKAYGLLKSYQDLDKKINVFVCVESLQGCDQI